jgi:hypothetical protein
LTTTRPQQAKTRPHYLSEADVPMKAMYIKLSAICKGFLRQNQRVLF